MRININSFLRQARDFIQNRNFLTLLEFGFERRFYINMEGNGNGHAYATEIVQRMVTELISHIGVSPITR